MSTKLFWSAFADADCDSFNIYRAITGIAVTFPNSLVVGDAFIFAATSPTKQTVVITGTDIDTVIDDINTKAVGLSATKTSDDLTLLIRCTASVSPKLKLYPCTFLTHTSQIVRTIPAQTEFNLIANQVRTPAVFDYQYLDPNGDVSDWYRITSVKASVESIPSIPMQALTTPEALCVLEGRVIDLQNRPVAQTEVRISARPPVETSDNSGITQTDIVLYTDSYGRWSVPLLQGQSILFQIPYIGYNQVVTVPEQPYVLFKDLVPNNDHFYSPEGDPVS